jgi:hypothetical protein
VGQIGELATCESLGGDAGACSSLVAAGVAPDGGISACAACYETYVPPAGNGPAAWGYSIVMGVEPDVGDVAGAYGVGGGINVGGCVMATDPSDAGQTCGREIMGSVACELAVCLPLCPVPTPAPGQPLDPAALAALETCWQLAQQGACAEWADGALAACSGADTETAALGECAALVGQDEGLPDASPPTEASRAELLELLCGG